MTPKCPTCGGQIIVLDEELRCLASVPAKDSPPTCDQPAEPAPVDVEMRLAGAPMLPGFEEV